MLHPQCYTNLSTSDPLSLSHPHRHPTAFALTPNLNLFSSSDYQTTYCMASHNRASFYSQGSYNNSFSSCDYAPANLPSCNVAPKPGLSTNFLNYPSNSTYDTVYPDCNRPILPSCARMFHVPDPMSSNLNGSER